MPAGICKCKLLSIALITVELLKNDLKGFINFFYVLLLNGCKSKKWNFFK
jgi:hypothetical protein